VRVLVVVGEGELEIGWGYLAEGVFGELKYSFLLLPVCSCELRSVFMISKFYLFSFSNLLSPGVRGEFNINFSLFPFICLLSVFVGMECFCLGVICPFVFPLYDCPVRACWMGQAIFEKRLGCFIICFPCHRFLDSHCYEVHRYL